MTLSHNNMTLSVGTVAGREHRRIHRNNQDAWAARTTADLTVVVICDGCSSGARSEVGAMIGATWFVDAVIAHRGDAQAACGSVLTNLRTLASQSVDPIGFIAEHLLFTLVIAVVSTEHVRVFARGDGLVSVNGSVRVFDSGADNAPDYFSYALLGEDRPQALDVWLDVEASTIQSLAIATDGAVNALDVLAHAATQPVFAKNRSWLQRQLWASSANLHDDTTIALLRTREGA